MSDQDDEKKILNEDTTVSESENQPSVDQKDQPESVEGQNNDPNSNSNENTKIKNKTLYFQIILKNILIMNSIWISSDVSCKFLIN